jgi:hypothetical protein
MNSEGIESRPKPCLFVFPEHSKKRSAVAKACQGASSVDSTASGLATILLGEDLFSRQRDMIKVGKDVVYVHFAGYGDIPAFIHIASKGHLCSWRDL